jgi:hypothetical protein
MSTDVGSATPSPTLADLVGRMRLRAIHESMPCEAFTPLARRQRQDRP